MEMIGHFVVLVYSRTSDISRVNDAMEQLVAKKSRSLDTILPIDAALGQHLKRASYNTVELLEYISVSRSTVSKSS